MKNNSISHIHTGDPKAQKQITDWEKEFNQLWRLIQPRDSGDATDLMLQRVLHFCALTVYLRPRLFDLEMKIEHSPDIVFKSSGKKLVRLLQRGMREVAEQYHFLRHAFEAVDFVSPELWGDQTAFSKVLQRFYAKLPTIPDTTPHYMRSFYRDYFHALTQRLDKFVTEEDIDWSLTGFFVGNVLPHDIFQFRLDSSKLEIYDPCCGCGAMLADFFSDHPSSFYGQDINPLAVAICQLRILATSPTLDKPRNTSLAVGDTIGNPAFKDSDEDLKKFDVVICEPPSKLPSRPRQFIENDPFSRFDAGVPSMISAEYFFIAHALKSLKVNGRAAVIVPVIALSRGESGLDETRRSEVHIRKSWIDDNLLDMVVDFTPKGEGASTGGPEGAILFFRRGRSPHAPVSMVDLGTVEKRSKIGRLRGYPDAQKFLTYEAVEGMAKPVSQEQIRDNCYNLTPQDYISQKTISLDEKSLESLLAEVSQTENKLRRLSNKLERSRSRQTELINDLRRHADQK